MSTTQVSTPQEVIASGSSTIKQVMVSFKSKKVGFRIAGLESHSIWIDFDFFSPAMLSACRNEEGVQFDLLDEHLYHLTGQPVAWTAVRSALLKKGDKFESGSKVTADEFLVLKGFHLTASPIELRQVIKQNAKGVLIADFTSESSNIEKAISSFLNPKVVAKPVRKPRAANKKKTAVKK